MLKKSALLVLLASKAIASPTIYPLNPTALSNLTNNTNSNLIADNADAKRVWVMPPSVASATVGGLHTITANVGFCREMADIKDYSRALVAKLNDLTTQEVESKKQADELRKKLYEAREEAAKFAVQARLQDLVDVDNSITAAEQRLTELYAAANSCKKACNLINDEIDSIVKNKTVLIKQRREIVTQHAGDIREYEKRKATIEALNEDLADHDEAWLKISTRVTQVRSEEHTSELQSH